MSFKTSSCLMGLFKRAFLHTIFLHTMFLHTMFILSTLIPEYVGYNAAFCRIHWKRGSPTGTQLHVHQSLGGKAVWPSISSIGRLAVRSTGAAPVLLTANWPVRRPAGAWTTDLWAVVPDAYNYTSQLPIRLIFTYRDHKMPWTFLDADKTWSFVIRALDVFLKPYTTCNSSWWIWLLKLGCMLNYVK